MKKPEVTEEELKNEENLYILEKRPQAEKVSGGRIIIDFVKSLKPGVDLANQCSPTFALKPMSILEWFGHLMAPNNALMQVPGIKSETKRLLVIAKYLLKGISTIPQVGIQQCKGYNSVLGEQFKCQWKHDDGTTSRYVAEQVSHHPPMSAVYFEHTEKKINFSATLKPTVTLTSSLTSPYILGKFEGRQIINVTLASGENEQYIVQLPQFAARNLIGLIGDSYGELTDYLIVTCPKTGLELKLEFKSSNKVSGHIRNAKKKKVYKVQGVITGKVVCSSYETKKTSMLFSKEAKLEKEPQFECKPVAEQEKNESRRIWHRVTRAILKGNSSEASQAKNEIEEYERQLRKEREEGKAQKYTPELFTKAMNSNNKPIMLTKSVPKYAYKQ